MEPYDFTFPERRQRRSRMVHLFGKAYRIVWPTQPTRFCWDESSVSLRWVIIYRMSGLRST